MTRQSLVLAGWSVAWLATAAAAQSPGDATLKGRGLERSGATYVHASEAAALEKVGELKAAYQKLIAARYKLAEIDQNSQAIAELNQQAAYLQQEKNAMAAQTRNMGRLPRGAGNMIRQNVNAQQQQEQLAINQVKGQIDTLKKMAPTPQVRKGIEDDIAKRKEEASQAATEARKLVDETNAAYEALAKDDAIKAALAQVKTTTTDAIKLGPSKDFHAAVKSLDMAERLLGLKAQAEPKDAKRKARTKR